MMETALKIIDPHLHLFDLTHGEYLWLKDDNPPYWQDKQLIQHNFNENHLCLSGELSLAGFVHIEAGFNNNQPWQELAFHEVNCSSPFSSIAAINLLDSDSQFTLVLNKLLLQRSFKGIRHILDSQALSLLTSPQVLNNIKHLNQLSKQRLSNHKPIIFEVQLPFEDTQACRALHNVISTYPQLTFAINHTGFPPDFIDESTLNKNALATNSIMSSTQNHSTWRQNIISFAQYHNVIIKCSGWEMINRHYNADWLNKCITLVIENFGINKVMLASNFPLCLFSQTTYQAYWQYLLNLPVINALSEDEKSAISADNALYYYFD